MLKVNNNVKSVCFHVILYIYSPFEGIFPHMSVANTITFPGASLISSN